MQKIFSMAKKLFYVQAEGWGISVVIELLTVRKIFVENLLVVVACVVIKLLPVGKCVEWKSSLLKFLGMHILFVKVMCA